jgi:hypothetical protein
LNYADYVKKHKETKTVPLPINFKTKKARKIAGFFIPWSRRDKSDLTTNVNK